MVEGLTIFRIETTRIDEYLSTMAGYYNFISSVSSINFFFTLLLQIYTTLSYQFLLVSNLNKPINSFHLNFNPFSKQNHHTLYISRPLKISSTLQMTLNADDSNNISNTNEDITKSISIVQVKCNSSENELLRQGVTELFKLYFDELYELGCDLGFQGFQSEWIDLPGKYDFEKRGGLFVAVEYDHSHRHHNDDGNLILPPLLDRSQIVGCIAIRPLTDTCGEVKRMYIRKSHRRLGIGKLLAESIVDHAFGELGEGGCSYDEVKLDSLERLVGAVKLYENMGFQRIPPYCECPEVDHVCMNMFRS